jgi:Cupin superfamily (DUF985)
VHYYQGGKPFEYTIYDPTTKKLSTHVLGPDIMNGQVLQFPVKGGLWKCGRLLVDDLDNIDADYCIISEAVGPGFDVHDFHFVNSKDLDEQQLVDDDDNDNDNDNDNTRAILQSYLNDATESTEQVSSSKPNVDEKNKVFDRHYD